MQQALQKYFSDYVVFLKFLGFHYDDAENFRIAFLSYSSCITFFYDFILELLLFLQKILIERQLKSIIDIRNPKAFNGLRDTRHIFINENTFLKSDESQIKGILLFDKFIEIDAHEKNKIISYFRNKNQNSKTILGKISNFY